MQQAPTTEATEGDPGDKEADLTATGAAGQRGGSAFVFIILRQNNPLTK